MEREPNDERGGRGRGREWKETTRAIFHAVFDSRSSFFAPKPNGNAGYAGYLFKSVVMMG